MASWHIKLFIINAYCFRTTVNLSIVLLSHTVFNCCIIEKYDILDAAQVYSEQHRILIFTEKIFMLTYKRLKLSIKDSKFINKTCCKSESVIRILQTSLFSVFFSRIWEWSQPLWTMFSTAMPVSATWWIPLPMTSLLAWPNTFTAQRR